MDKQTLKTAVISSGTTAFIFIAFILGMKFTSNPEPAPAPVPDATQAATIPAPVETQAARPAPSPDVIIDHLLAVEERVQHALDYMKKATIKGKGGNVESSRTELAQTVDHLSAAIQYAKEHPEITQSPAPPATLDITRQFDVTHTGKAGAAPNLRNAMEELKPALEEFHKTPGGDLGGFRDKILDDIRLASDDIAAGYAMAAGTPAPAPAPTPPAPGPVKIQGLLPAAAGDMASGRLLALQASLKTVRADLEQARTIGKPDFLDKILADLTDADAAVAAALDYIKVHADADALPPRAGAPDFVVFAGLGVFTQPAISDTYPTLRAASDNLSQAIRQFTSSPPDGPIMSDLGGNRDAILRQLTITDTDLVNSATKLAGRQTNNTSYIPAMPDAPAGTKPGSISGAVLAIDGKPAANAAITFLIRNPAPNAPRLPGSGNLIMIGGGGLAGTITDEQGRFTIRELPPGGYAINISLPPGRNGQSPEAAAKAFTLKEGEEATLDAPVRLMKAGGMGG